MKVIQTNDSSTLSVQTVTPTINDRPQPREICILIEDEHGDHLANLTPPQAADLITAIKGLIAEIEPLNHRSILKMPNSACLTSHKKND